METAVYKENVQFFIYILHRATPYENQVLHYLRHNSYSMHALIQISLIYMHTNRQR